MDGWALVLSQFGVRSLNFAFLGRWLGHLPQGSWVQASIAGAAPVRGERLLGWTAHYSIDISFAALLLSTFGLTWARSPSLLLALVLGIGTVVAPLFILKPALGAGIASSKTAHPILNSMKRAYAHRLSPWLVLGRSRHGVALDRRRLRALAARDTVSCALDPQSNVVRDRRPPLTALRFRGSPLVARIP